jgi:hypothetical protein
VVAGWLTLLDHTPDPGDVWVAGTVVIVDEATQISTRDAERLLQYARSTGTVLVLVGDPLQLGSVGTGGWFRHLVDLTADVPGLSLNQRQRGERMRQVRQALAELRRQHPDADQAALHRLAGDGRVAVFDHREDMLAAIVADWYTERHTTTTGVHRGSGVSGVGDRSRMMAEHHRDTDLLNHAARERLTADGTLTGRTLRVVGRDFQVGDEVITLTQAGHTLVPAGRARGDYIRTGTIGIITRVHLDPARVDRQHLGVTFPGRGEVRVDWAYLTHTFPDGRDGGLAHAYAFTAHKAEGSTMRTAHAAVADDTSRSGLYVMLSRPRDDLRAYVIRRADLRADLDDEDWLPILNTGSGPVRSLLDRLADSGPECLTTDTDPIAQAAHDLATTHTLADLTRLRRTAQHTIRARAARGTGDRAEVGQRQRQLLIVRRAEIAAEAATAHAALATPGPQLMARIGPRPTGGSDRAVWDRAVSALAVFHARHDPDGEPHRLPDTPLPTGGDDGIEGEWYTQRALAEDIAATWAHQLDQRRANRFHSHMEIVPRQRAVTAIHALLAHGWSPDAITTALTADPIDDVRTAAAVLDYRSHILLDNAGIDPAYYDLPPAVSPAGEWQHAHRLLHAAETRHLADQPTGELAGERRRLTAVLTHDPTQRRQDAARQHPHVTTARERALAAANRLQAAHQALDRARVRPFTSWRTITEREQDVLRARQDLAERRHDVDLADTWARAATGDTPAREALRTRLRLVDDALAHQIDAAVLALRQEPAPYLTALLGYRPAHEPASTAWERRAITVEHYRHHTLALPYGQPAAPAGAPASEQALGPRPTDPIDRVTYDRARHPQPTLDLGTDL